MSNIGGNNNHPLGPGWLIAIIVAMIGAIAVIYAAQINNSEDRANITRTQVAIEAQQTAISAPQTSLTQEVLLLPRSDTEVVVSAPQSVRVCPNRQETGLDSQVSLHISVPDGYVQYLGGSRFDNVAEGVIVTITGPYEGQHTLFQGAWCDPVAIGSGEDIAAREQIEREVAFGGVECPNWCPIEHFLPTR